jgi:hypothetical protein
MINRVHIARLIGAALVGFVLQPEFSSLPAQQAPLISVDSVNKHVRSYPKAKKASVKPMAARTSGAPSAKVPAKAPRAVPSVIVAPAATNSVRPAQATAVPPTARRATSALHADSVPAVRRAPTVPKKSPPR